MERTRRQTERHWRRTLGIVVLATVAYVGVRTLGSVQPPSEQKVLVTGVSWSPDRPGCISLQTDKGVFVVAEDASLPHPDANPWFWFRVGEAYRVQIRGERPRLLGGTGRDRIVQAQFIPHSVNVAVSGQ